MNTFVRFFVITLLVNFGGIKAFTFAIENNLPEPIVGELIDRLDGRQEKQQIELMPNEVVVYSNRSSRVIINFTYKSIKYFIGRDTGEECWGLQPEHWMVRGYKQTLNSFTPEGPLPHASFKTTRAQDGKVKRIILSVDPGTNRVKFDYATELQRPAASAAAEKFAHARQEQQIPYGYHSAMGSSASSGSSYVRPQSAAGSGSAVEDLPLSDMLRKIRQAQREHVPTESDITPRERYPRIGFRAALVIFGFPIDYKPTEEEVKAKYRVFARYYHPDKVDQGSKDDADTVFKLLGEAKDRLLRS